MLALQSGSAHVCTLSEVSSSSSHNTDARQTTARSPKNSNGPGTPQATQTPNRLPDTSMDDVVQARLAQVAIAPEFG